MRIDFTKFPDRDKHEPYYQALVAVDETMVEIIGVVKKMNEVITAYNVEHGTSIEKTTEGIAE